MKFDDTFQFDSDCENGSDSDNRRQQILEQRFIDELENNTTEKEKYEAQIKLEENMLVRDIKAASLRRQEEAARTEEDFKAIIKKWDKLDENRERKERYNELLRDENIDSGCSYLPDLKVFPKYLNTTSDRQLSRGYFLDYMYDCPYEMHDLTSIRYARDIVKDLKPEHKEILYFLGVKHFKVSEVAAMRGQSDRNIRRSRQVVYNKIWKDVYKALIRKQKNGCRLNSREREFITGYENGTLVIDNGK